MMSFCEDKLESFILMHKQKARHVITMVLFNPNHLEIVGVSLSYSLLDPFLFSSFRVEYSFPDVIFNEKHCAQLSLDCPIRNYATSCIAMYEFYGTFSRAMHVYIMCRLDIDELHTQISQMSASVCDKFIADNTGQSRIILDSNYI